MPIIYLKGDCTRPQGEGNKLIVHICNDIGAWGRGFVLALSKRWKEPESIYRKAKSYDNLNLGNIQFVRVEPDIYVINMIAQHGIRQNVQDEPPIRYDALYECLTAIRLFAESFNMSVHMPRIGTGLAGGDWKIIEKIIHKTLNDVNVYVYDLK